MRLEEITVAAQTNELSPPSSIGVAVGADIPEADSTVIRTGSMRAKVAGGIDLAATASGKTHWRWRRAGRLRLRPHSLLIPLAIGLASKTRKRFGIALGLGRFGRGWSGLAATPNPLKQEYEKNEANTGERIERQVELYDRPLLLGAT
jgi:hypothetical protein